MTEKSVAEEVATLRGDPTDWGIPPAFRLEPASIPSAGWNPRDEAEQLEADIQDEMYRLRREARAKRITKEAKKRIRKEGK